MTHANRPKHLGPIESVISQELQRSGACTFEELVKALPDYSWSQVFLAVDQLSRDGLLHLKRQGRFDYLISIPSPNLPACNVSLT
ncbi:MAG: hypothetical protein D4R81_05470 [Nitrospiraceae bacterium]|nr:MAG: hypothetical protein D4R81_05470 [Nitrospiraceae bacterium]